MHIAVDVDGTIDAAPSQLQSLMSAVKAAGQRVTILTGTSNPTATQADFDAKANYLSSLGCGQCWDDMVVCAHPNGDVSDAKAAWLKDNSVDVLIDNDKGNAKAALKAGVPLVLVPWGSRQ